MHMSPCGHILPRLIAVHTLRPREPVAVHLVIEAQEEWMPPVLRRLGKAAYIGVISSGYDIGQPEVGLAHARRRRLRAPAQERNRPMLAHARHQRCRESVEGAR